MKILRKATEDEMLLSFLKGELKSTRFADDLTAAIATLQLSEAVIARGDLNSAQENERRKAIMHAFRGYPDSEVFAEYPKAAEWYFVRFERDDLEKIRYISYCYWDELSGGTSSPLVAAENVKKGITVYNVPNDNFLNAADALRSGAVFDPVILIAKGNTFVTLEGHVRMTAYAMEP